MGFFPAKKAPPAIPIPRSSLGNWIISKSDWDSSSFRNSLIRAQGFVRTTSIPARCKIA